MLLFYFFHANICFAVFETFELLSLLLKHKKIFSRIFLQNISGYLLNFSSTSKGVLQKFHQFGPDAWFMCQTQSFSSAGSEVRSGLPGSKV